MAMAARIRDFMGRGEDELTETIESGTAEIPSVAFLAAAGGAMVVSLLLVLSGRKNTANFIGQWVPTILIMGLYNKLVKQLGHD